MFPLLCALNEAAPCYPVAFGTHHSSCMAEWEPIVMLAGARSVSVVSQQVSTHHFGFWLRREVALGVPLLLCLLAYVCM